MCICQSIYLSIYLSSLYISPHLFFLHSLSCSQLVDTFNTLGNALKKATAAHEEFVALLPPHLEGITHALQSIEEAQHKKRKRAEKDPDAPKKPATSYFLFSNAIRGKVKEEHP